MIERMRIVLVVAATTAILLVAAGIIYTVQRALRPAARYRPNRYRAADEPVRLPPPPLGSAPLRLPDGAAGDSTWPLPVPLPLPAPLPAAARGPIRTARPRPRRNSRPW